MKHYQKIVSCLIIVAFCATGMMLGGCKKLRAKKHKFSVASEAVVNSMMVTNPMGALFGKDESTTSKIGGVESYAALTGCPAVSLSPDLIIGTGVLVNLKITIAYAPDCIVNGIAMSGTVNGQWYVKVEHSKLYTETVLNIENLAVEGLTTNGYIHTKLFVQSQGTLAQIDGNMATKHADGRVRSMTFDNLTSELDLSGMPEAICKGLGGCDNLATDMPKFVINGNATYKDEDDNTYIMDYDTVTQPLVCGFPTSGTVHLVDTANDYDAVIDYSGGGSDNCDSIVTVTIDGESQDVDISVYVKRRQYRF